MVLVDSEENWGLVAEVLDKVAERCQTFEKWGFTAWYAIDPDGLPHIHVETIGGKR